MFFGMITCANLLHWSSMLNMTLSSCFTSSAFGSFNKASLSGLSKINCWMLTDPTRNSFSRNGKISERSRRSSLVGNLRLAEKVFVSVSNSWLHNLPSTMQRCSRTVFDAKQQLLLSFTFRFVKKQKNKTKKICLCALSPALRSVLKALRRRKKIIAANVNGRINPALPPLPLSCFLSKFSVPGLPTAESAVPRSRSVF